jgi:hypothetical protein
VLKKVNERFDFHSVNCELRLVNNKFHVILSCFIER